MSDDTEELVPYFIPSLSSILVAAEDKKGTPLEYDEVVEIRDRSACIMLPTVNARKMDESRGYVDVDPDNLWYAWQLLRREMGRKPDIDPGPSFAQVNSSSSEYQNTVREAHGTLAVFRQMIPSDGSPRMEAMIKTKLRDSGSEAYLWLASARVDGRAFVAEIFEAPKFFSAVKIGQQFRVEETDLVDWMINEDGKLYGGFSLRLHRSTLSPEQQAEFDEFIGVSEYA